MNSTSYRFPSRIADLGFSVDLPQGWKVADLPDDLPDFDNPTALVALAIVTAPYATIVFSFAARPAYSDGTLFDWANYLLVENGIRPLAFGQHAAGAHPAWVGEALVESDLGPMRVRFAFIEDGRRIVNITLTAPDALAGSVQGSWFEALASFRLEEARGATVAMQPEVQVPESDNVPGASVIAEPPEPPEPPPQSSNGPQHHGRKWWQRAKILEASNRLHEAERTVLEGAQDIGGCISLAELFRSRMVRLQQEGDVAGAREARAKAEEWANQYAAQATSGGEGVALSRERDAFLASLGPAF